MRSALLLVAVGVVAALASAPARPRPAAPAPPAEVAPMPREDTRVHLESFEGGRSRAPDTDVVERQLKVEWLVNVAIRRLVSTGRDVIDFKWRIKYDGPRHPLIIRRPSLTDSVEGTTVATLYAFPPGRKEGRAVTFTARGDVEWIFQNFNPHSPPSWWLQVEKGEAAEGTDAVLVADVKELLRTRYPAEFPADKPPKLYAKYAHLPRDRGWGRDLDAWTGELGTIVPIEVPDLKSW